MKVTVYEDPTLQNDYATIHCCKKTEDIEELVSIIKHKEEFTIIGLKDDQTHLLHLDDILYFESVDKKCFAYLSSDVLEVTYTLKELESALTYKGFLRINRSTIVNIYQIDYLKAEHNMRITAYLSNKEKLIINRHYNKNFQANLEKIKSQLLGDQDEINQ